MAHIGEEVTLCFIGGTGGVQGILQNLSLLFFFVFLVIDTAGKKIASLSSVYGLST